MQLISPQEAEAKVAARYRVFLVLWIGIFVSVVLFLMLLHFPKKDHLRAVAG